MASQLTLGGESEDTAWNDIRATPGFNFNRSHPVVLQ